MKDSIRIPVSATIRIIDGEAVIISADYAEVDASAFAQWLIERAKPIITP